MPFEITMPQLGLTMETGTIVEWLVAEGDPIRPNQEIVQVETDKAVVSVEAHQEGHIERILVHQGREVPVGTTLAIAVAPGESLPDDWQPEPAADPEASQATAQTGTLSAPQLVPQTQAEVLDASWKARTMARQQDVDLRLVEGSGPKGRIISADISRANAQKSDAQPHLLRVTPVAENLAAALGLDLTQVTSSREQSQITQADVLASAAALIRQQSSGAPAPKRGPAQVTRSIPLSGVRKVVSEGMSASAQSTARVTLFRQIDATGIISLRQRFSDQDQPVSYNDLLIYTCAQVLRDFPEANARLGEGEIEYLDRINIGLATDTERGLLVPVVHSADRKTITQIASETSSLIQAAREGRCLPDELSGGTFTITNLGMLGVEGFTPVINLPESCILGVGTIIRQPVVRNDDIVVRPMMTLSLAFDHRTIDGAPAARFLERIAQLLQDPMMLLSLSHS